MKLRTMFLAALAGAVAHGAAADSLVELANPLQGTDSTRSFSHGNMYPAIAVPFPMNVWAPYTQPASDPFYYQYQQHQIRGIRQTHQPSPWIGDYANFSLMPVFGKLAVTEGDRASDFRHATEVARPSYYRVRLDKWHCTAEVTPTERAARFRFTYEEGGDAYVVLDAFDNHSSVEIIPGANKVIGVCRDNHGGVPDNFSNYFVIEFDRPFTGYGVWTPDKILSGQTSLAAGHVGAYFKFKVTPGQTVECRVASSYVSPAQAQRNLDREIGGADFDTVLKRADAKWNEALGRIRVSGGSAEQRRTFYSAFYRSIIFPHRFFELDAAGQPVYFSPYDGKIHQGYLYTDTGFWDTFRAAHPFYNLIFPEVSEQMMQSLVAAYQQSGWLPEWASPGHRDCMIGDHAFSLLADAWVKGITNFDANTAVDAMVHDANTQGPDWCRSIGRDGAEFYKKLGYVPYPNVSEATAKTLEYAYDDFCAAVLAQAVGRPATAEAFARSAMNYTNVLDTQIGFVRGRQANGEWCRDFHPDEWGGPFTEGNAWQWTWSVFQDVPGLMKRLGGPEAFGRKLDDVFYTPPTVRVGTYHGVIHEMTEMVALNMGQYAHGNEPVHHMLYLYDYAGQPWKAQSRLRQVMTLLYQPTPDGMCGDEDTGQMSAWYVFSAMGFYPVTPGTVDYLIGSPLFDRVTIQLPGGKNFAIVAHNNGPQKPYIQGATLDGQPFDKTYVTHGQILRGGELRFEMGSAPDYHWGVSPGSRPPSAMSVLRQ